MLPLFYLREGCSIACRFWEFCQLLAIVSYSFSYVTNLPKDVNELVGTEAPGLGPTVRALLRAHQIPVGSRSATHVS
jgi:hypothetical protein